MARAASIAKWRYGEAPKDLCGAMALHWNTAKRRQAAALQSAFGAEGREYRIFHEMKVHRAKQYVRTLYLCRQAQGKDFPMTPEEQNRYERIDRQLEFLANHQAQLHVEIEALKELTRQNSEQIARNSEQIAQHSEQIGQLGTQLGQLGDYVLRMGRVFEQQARAADERMARTDERLNALIASVERYLNRDNGKE